MKILFPTDFSEAADHAFIYALKLADKLGAEILTLHVYELPNVRGAHLPNTIRRVYDSITFETFENYKDYIPHIREIAAEANMAHITCKHALVRGTHNGTIKAIVNHADKAGADFIIMGTTGASGLKEVFLGSVAAEVLENSNCPVLAVPFKAQFDGKIDKIAYCTDYHSLDHETLASAEHFAGWFDAELYIVHVDVSHTEDLSHKMDKFVAEAGSYEHLEKVVIKHNSVEQGIAQFVEDNNIDLIAMRIKQRNFIQELFTYSMTKKMANHLRVPVLGLHNDK